MENSIYRIKDICSIKSGKRIPLGMDFATGLTNHPYIRARDIKNGSILTDNLVYIEEKVFNKIKKYIIQSGDIAITIVGASVGDVAIATDDVEGYNLTENAVRLTDFNKEVNGKYVFYQLVQKQYRDYMQIVAGAAAQPKLGIYKIERIKVALPKKQIQDKVVSAIATYDELIKTNAKRIKVLDQMAENLYKEWFVRFRFPGHEKAVFNHSSPKGWILGENADIKIPSTWHFGKLSEIASFVRGKNITAAEMIEGETPVISAGLEPSGFHNAYNVEGDNLTVSASGANAGFLGYHLENIWAADCSYYNGDYLWFVYNTLKFLQPVISNLQCGAAQPHVYPKNINKLSVIIPKESQIIKYCEAVESIYKEIKILLSNNDSLTKQRDLLLPRLMSGKLEV